VAERRVPLSNKKKLIVQRGGFLLPLLSAVLPAIASFIFSPGQKKIIIMLRKMYLVPAEKYSEVPKKHSPPIPEVPKTQSLSPPPQKKKKKKKKTKKTETTPQRKIG